AMERQADFPGRKPRRVSPERSTDMLLLEHDGLLLLHKRPPVGIWGGLWSLPETDDAHSWLAARGCVVASRRELASLTHTFSHFRLHIRPVHVQLEQPPAQVADVDARWYDPAATLALGLAAPVRRILENYMHEETAGAGDGTNG